LHVPVNLPPMKHFVLPPTNLEWALEGKKMKQLPPNASGLPSNAYSSPTKHEKKNSSGLQPSGKEEHVMASDWSGGCSDARKAHFQCYQFVGIRTSGLSVDV